METYIKEESFFECLTWLCHTLCGLILSIIVGDNFLFNEYDSSIIHMSCAKMPKWILVEESILVYYNLYMVGHTVVTFVGFGIQIAIFRKQKQLERQQSVVLCSVSYNTIDVKIIRKINQSSNRKLWRFRRNVISPLGSFLSFQAGVVYNLLVSLLYFKISPSDPPIIAELLIFSVHDVYFFCLNLIESLCSPPLRNSLIDVIPWLRHKYQDVIV